MVSQYSTEGKIKEPNMAADMGSGLMGVLSSYSKKDMGGVLKGGMGLVRTAAGSNQKVDKWAKANKSNPADVVRFRYLFLHYSSLKEPSLLLQISWSGCKDSQTSADTFEAGMATGAMSYVREHALHPVVCCL
jgi:metacaspase-1